MARVKTLRARVREIRRKYKKVNRDRFFYNKKRDLSGRYNRIKCWFLIHDSEKGYSVFPIEFKRHQLMTVPTWTRLLNHDIHDGISKPPTPGVYESIFSIFTQKILPAINVRSGNTWKFKALIGWAASFEEKKKERNAIRSTKNSAAHRARNKTSKKRHADARHSSRHRHRN
jgi:hypothetical protein